MRGEVLGPDLLLRESLGGSLSQQTAGSNVVEVYVHYCAKSSRRAAKRRADFHTLLRAGLLPL